LKYGRGKNMGNNEIISENIGDKRISVALMASFVILTVQFFILTYFNLTNSVTANFIQYASKIIVGLTYLYALPVVWRRSKKKFILTYFIASFIILLNYLLFPANIFYLNEYIIPICFISLPSFIYALSIYNFCILKKTMKSAAHIVFIFGTLVGILVFSGVISLEKYSMSLSYYMLLPTLIFLNELLEKFSLKKLLITFISIVMIIALGSRGAILCVFVFLILRFIKFNINKSYWSYIKYILTLGFIFLMLLYLDTFLMYLNNVLLEFGVYSRNIQTFFSERISLSGRDTLYKTVFGNILNSPLLGIGIAGDRQILNGSYVHNLFLEILANFGLVIGFFIIISIIIFILICLFLRDRKLYNIFILWLCIGFIHLWVSYSYLTDFRFWAFMGVMINILFFLKKDNVVSTKKYKSLRY
jgi:O-Antigen ligase